jgi:hypothetical protein
VDLTNHYCNEVNLVPATLAWQQVCESEHLTFPPLHLIAVQTWSTRNIAANRSRSREVVIAISVTQPRSSVQFSFESVELFQPPIETLLKRKTCL